MKQTVASDDSLKANCEQCFALCCVMPTLTKSADFAIDKPANEPCPNLGQDFRCTIHSRLRCEGYSGCVAFDCYGAGQKVSQHTFAGRDWRSEPALLPKMSLVFRVQWQLHLSLHYLTEALDHALPSALRERVQGLIDEVRALTFDSAEVLSGVDVLSHKQSLHQLLWQVSQAVRRDPSEPLPPSEG